MNAATILIDEEQARIVHGILARHLPQGVQAYAFGSRAGGTPKPWSDLDLVLEGEAPLPIALLAELAEAFDESPLPWKVDLVDRATVGESFGKIIDAGKLPLA